MKKAVKNIESSATENKMVDDDFIKLKYLLDELTDQRIIILNRYEGQNGILRVVRDIRQRALEIIEKHL